RIKGKLRVMKKALLVTFISFMQLFFWVGEGGSCLAQTSVSEVRYQGIVDKIKVFPHQSRVMIQWTLQEPVRNLNFILERQNAQGFFEMVSASRSTRQLTYTLSDLDPITEGSVTYRVRYTRIGSYENLGHSELFTLHWDSGETLTIYPNPVRDVANLKLPKSNKAESIAIRVSSSEGNSVYQASLNAASYMTQRLDVQRYRPGTYYLHVSTHNQHWVSRFVKI
ncbi:MAG: T9SS type A sorting domain-containing protein, partial [Bacteroidota bacterium]